eukprot:TCALIF_04903-PA protein Name:"Similar to CG9791 ATP-dependent RNA helicase SUV3 homolog, mitochondrial (Drosophila melanogaster)" AED:0.08 eAED:0.08 QI:0/0.66/0.57/1/1/1/7/22/758
MNRHQRNRSNHGKHGDSHRAKTLDEFASSVFKGHQNKTAQDSSPKNINQLFKPLIVKANPDDMNLGEQIAGKLDKSTLLRALNKFLANEEIKKLSKEHGLDEYLYHQAYVSFRKFCLDVQYLPTDLYILFCDVLQGAKSIDDVFPFFLQHARKVFPHLECLDDLKVISDLTNPPNWYPEARQINRKIIFHAGPTNSGKTYHALERFMSAKSGVYCGPLKLLAVEVFNKCKTRDVPCDLITGEERKYACEDQEPANHVSCTVEMSNLTNPFEVAVIDEIQMIKDYQRGWAWTRALLGIPAEEVHVCGEASAIDLVKELCISTGEEVEVRTNKRLTELKIMDKAVQKFENVEPGDCIVCFSKNDIYTVSRALERMGVECAVIYGSLPPGTKLAMSEKFNDPNDPCKVLVATDAIGMGLNLNIRRIVFYSTSKICLLENGEKEVGLISVSQALQIAGRAGRYNTQWETGYVTTFNQDEINIMKDLLKQTPPDILQAGLHPSFDQIEMYAYHLPHAGLANLVDIFISLSTLDDSSYFLCHTDDFKFLANMIEHIKLPLKANRGELITFDWLCHQIGWPFSPPNTILDLVQMEAVHDVMDSYLWLSYRFPDMFPDVMLISDVREELDIVIAEGVTNIVQLLRNSESGVSSSAAKVDEDAFDARNRQNRQDKAWRHTQLPKISNDSVSSQSLTRPTKKTFSALVSDEDLDEIQLKPSAKLSELLQERGLLTKEIFSSLRREWLDKLKQEQNLDNPDSPSKNKPK